MKELQERRQQHPLLTGSKKVCPANRSSSRQARPVKSISNASEQEALRIRTRHISCGIPGCEKRYSSTDARRRHIRRAHKGWEDYQRPSYWADLEKENRRDGKHLTIKLPPDVRKQRTQSRRDEER